MQLLFHLNIRSNKYAGLNNNFRINSLLLADELRELVMREAFSNPNYSTSDDVYWMPLDYPTPMDDLEMKPVQRICDLKKKQYVFLSFYAFWYDYEKQR